MRYRRRKTIAESKSLSFLAGSIAFFMWFRFLFGLLLLGGMVRLTHAFMTDGPQLKHHPALRHFLGRDQR